MTARLRRPFDERTPLDRVLARLCAVVAIGLVAASGGLLSEMSRLAKASQYDQAQASAALADRG
jgi:hypothetical protein